jgi:hypothetical protein
MTSAPPALADWDTQTGTAKVISNVALVMKRICRHLRKSIVDDDAEKERWTACTCLVAAIAGAKGCHYLAGGSLKLEVLNNANDS